MTRIQNAGTEVVEAKAGAVSILTYFLLVCLYQQYVVEALCFPVVSPAVRALTLTVSRDTSLHLAEGFK